jgi:hypothetical protein
VFLSERLYFGLVASLLPIDTPNRHPGGCRFSFSPYGWQERDVSTYRTPRCLLAEHEISAPLAALNAKNTYITLSNFFQPNYKILKLSRQDIISQYKSTIGLDCSLPQRPQAGTCTNMKHQHETPT